MKVVLKFRGLSILKAKDGGLYARVPYKGTYPVIAGDRLHHKLGVYTVTGKE